MRYFTDRPFTASLELGEGIPKEIGRGAAVLLIVGSSLALASLAWFLVGLFMN
jgi:hypothetical protein